MDAVIHIENPEQPEVVAMLAASDAFHAALYPPESNHLLDIASLTAPEVTFFVARLDGRVTGIGAIVRRDQYAEIKRMYVDPGMRGHQLGRRILEALERQARVNGLFCLRLETGIRQAEAINLYRSAGYCEVGPFGSYKPDPLSLFMEKTLPAGDSTTQPSGRVDRKRNGP
jgi:putative acetyltransferase